ncbi:MAG: glycosyltransferase [Burkholderiaceae bacterium]|nr:glycosyltransferase [Burkholderiaceae bacterium]
MRVVYFVSLFPCWSETFIVREILALMRRGVEVRIVSLKPPSESLVQSDAQGLLDRVFYPVSPARNAWRVAKACLTHPLREARSLIELLRHLGGRPESLAKSLVVWWRTLGLVDELRDWAPQHLHAHWATYPSTSAMWMAERLGLPFSFTAHAHDIFLEDQLLGPKLARARFAVTISDFNRRFLARERGHAAALGMHVIHCGVSPQGFAFQPEGREPRLVMAVGRLDEIKGFPDLIEACGLLQQRGVDFRCEIIGEGPLRGRLEAAIARLGLQDRVRLLGARQQEEVRALLYRASVFVLPSVVTDSGDRDGIPVALMEAMAAGLPVVSTQVSGIPELVIDDDTGLTAPEHDPALLASRIERLLADPALGQRLARRARALVQAQFDIDLEAGKLHDALQR